MSEIGRCPICQRGNASSGKCDYCAWELEIEDEWRRECDYKGKPLIHKADIKWIRDRKK